MICLLTLLVLSRRHLAFFTGIWPCSPELVLFYRHSHFLPWAKLPMSVGYCKGPVWSAMGPYRVVQRGCDVWLWCAPGGGVCSAEWAQVFGFCVSSMGCSACPAAWVFFLSGCCCVCAAGRGSAVSTRQAAVAHRGLLSVPWVSAVRGGCWRGFASCCVSCFAAVCYF